MPRHPVRIRMLSALAGLVAATLALGGCAGTGDPNTLRIVYQTTATFDQMQTLMETTRDEFAELHPDITVELVPIQSEGNEYYTKLALMNRAEVTAPDVMYEDTFRIQSDAAAGYLRPIEDEVAAWDEWELFAEGARDATLGADGLTYAVPLGTDTRALWYNTELFAEAGLPVPWQPATWDDVLAAAATLRDAFPDVIPFNIYSGIAPGEAAAMQGFEMLLSGTDDWLYDTGTQKWITGSQGFRDSLGFVAEVFDGDLGPSLQQALDPNLFASISSDWLPNGELAIALDGSWLSGTWLDDGSAPWPEWNDVLGVAPMPTQNGQGAGSTSMSGGWSLAVGSKTTRPDLAFEFVQLATSRQNALSYVVDASQIAVRADVADDPDYLDANPSFADFTPLVDVTTFRPTTEVYDQISSRIQIAMDAVMTGEASVDEAADAYDRAVERIVGRDQTQEAAS